jgi:hypothetical protein
MIRIISPYEFKPPMKKLIRGLYLTKEWRIKVSDS